MYSCIDEWCIDEIHGLSSILESEFLKAGPVKTGWMYEMCIFAYQKAVTFWKCVSYSIPFYRVLRMVREQHKHEICMLTTSKCPHRAPASGHAGGSKQSSCNGACPLAMGLGCSWAGREIAWYTEALDSPSALQKLGMVMHAFNVNTPEAEARRLYIFKVILSYIASSRLHETLSRKWMNEWIETWILMADQMLPEGSITWIFKRKEGKWYGQSICILFFFKPKLHFICLNFFMLYVWVCCLHACTYTGNNARCPNRPEEGIPQNWSYGWL